MIQLLAIANPTTKSISWNGKLITPFTCIIVPSTELVFVPDELMFFVVTSQLNTNVNVIEEFVGDTKVSGKISAKKSPPIKEEKTFSFSSPEEDDIGDIDLNAIKGNIDVRETTDSIKKAKEAAKKMLDK